MLSYEQPDSIEVSQNVNESDVDSVSELIQWKCPQTDSVLLQGLLFCRV